MSKSIRVLIVEDSENDTDLILRELQRGGFDPTSERVETHKAMDEALERRKWDVVIADYSMPQFSGAAALKLLQKKVIDIPFILVSGAIGEEVAVEAMRAGAHDYVMKDNLSRLVPAIERELREAKERQRHKQAAMIIKGLNRLNEDLIYPKSLNEKLESITNGVVKIFNADFARIWITKPGDLCNSGCIHTRGTDKVNTCHQRERCLHLVASSGRYTNIDDEVHRRVPLGCYKIGLIATGEKSKFINNDVTHDPQIYNHEWTRKLGLVSFAGYRLQSKFGKPIGVLALFSKHIISPDEDILLKGLADTTAHVVQAMMAEEELRKLSHAVEQSPNTVIITNIKGNIEYVNPKFTALTGYTAEEALGKNPRILKSGKQPFEFYKELWDTIMSGKEFHGELCNKKKNGELYWESISISALKNQKGTITHFVGVKEDITKRKQMEEYIRRHSEELEKLVEERTKRIQELERQRMENEKLAITGRMAARVAHEINNPLAGIQYSFLLIKDSVPKDHKHYVYVGRIEKEIGRIASIVKQMFDLSRPPSKSHQEFNINATIYDVMAMLKGNCEKYGVKINYDTCNESLMVFMFEGSLRQVLFNIIQNAIEASPKGGEVKITLKDGEEYLTIMVADKGNGIPDELHRNIFEPFFTTKSKIPTGGLGLGLSICKNVLETMGGSLSFKSEKNKGTTFTIELPIQVFGKTEMVSA